MKTIKITNPKLKEYLLLSEKEIVKGRTLSQELEEIEKEIETLNNNEKEITSKIEPKELIEKGHEINNKIQELIKELSEVTKKIQDIKIEAIPKDMYNRHYELRDIREKKERERNKVALKIQKIKDRIKPEISKAVKSKLEEFEDVSNAEIVGDEIVISIYNRIYDVKEALRGNKKG